MRYYASVSYDGSLFSGYQSQPHKNTIQDQLKSVFSGFFGRDITIHAVSRTDAGVHAYDQRICWDIDTPVPFSKFPQILNARLNGVRLHWCQPVNDDFLIRQVGHQKEYHYKIKFGRIQPFFEKYFWCKEKNCANISAVKEIMNLFEGEHDFYNFCKVDKTKNIADFSRTVKTDLFWENESTLVLVFKGKSFLWKMVRYLSAFAMYCGEGQCFPEDVFKMFERSKLPHHLEALAPAPPQGLYLYSNNPMVDMAQYEINIGTSGECRVIGYSLS